MTTLAIAKLPAAAAALLRENHACALLASLAVIKASGPAIRDYLQGQLTQDMALLTPERGIYTTVLTPQGKPVADMRILEGHNGELLIISESSRAEALVGRLRRFAVGFEARIGIVDALAVFAVQGPGTDAALADCGLPVPTMNIYDTATSAEHETFSLRLPMAATDGVWVVCAKAEAVSCMRRLGHQITVEDMEAARIAHGFPRFGIDWDETMHPLNANLIERHGVSFDKGCYVGQEVTSRMHWRGQIKWQLCRVGLDAAVESLPCAVMATARMGEITSLAQTEDGEFRGIALLRIEAVESDCELRAEGTRLSVLGQALPV